MIKKLKIELSKGTFKRKMTMAFLCSLPIIDMSTSLTIDSSLQVGVLLKGFFSLYIFLNLFKISKPKMFFVAIFLILTIVVQTILNGGFSFSYLITNSIGSFKFFYFLLFSLWLVYLSKTGERINIRLVFEIWFYLIVFSFIASGLTGTYNKTYSWINSSKSWYYAGNEISSLLLVVFPIITYYIYIDKLKPIHIIPLLSMILISSFIGTKTIYFGYLLYLVLCFVFKILNTYIARKNINNLKIKLMKLALLGCSIIFMIGIYPVTPVGKQIKDHSDIISVTNTNNSMFVEKESSTTRIVVLNTVYNNSVIDIQHQKNSTLNFGTALTKTTNNSDYIQDNQLLSFLNSILKNRLVKVFQSFEIFSQRQPLSIITGIGTNVLVNGEKILIDTEMDLFTILIRYGVFSLLITLAFLFDSIKKFINILKLKGDETPYVLTLLFGFTMIVGAGIIAGHVFISPLVSISLSLIYIDLYNFNNKQMDDLHFNTERPGAI